jgi:hypothetical protein
MNNLQEYQTRNDILQELATEQAATAAAAEAPHYI